MSESVNDTLHRLRKTYPTPMTAQQFGQLLNDVAAVHPPLVLLGKAGGNNCPSPAGPRISCDFLVDPVTKRGWDVLSDAGEGGSGSVVGMGGKGEDLSGALADGSRTLVSPVGGAPTPPPPPPPSLSSHVGILAPRAALVFSVADLIAGPDPGTVVAVWPAGSKTYLSVQPDGRFETRTAIGTWEIGVRDGNIVVYTVDGRRFGVPIVVAP